MLYIDTSIVLTDYYSPAQIEMLDYKIMTNRKYELSVIYSGGFEDEESTDHELKDTTLLLTHSDNLNTDKLVVGCSWHMGKSVDEPDYTVQGKSSDLGRSLALINKHVRTHSADILKVESDFPYMLVYAIRAGSNGSLHNVKNVYLLNGMNGPCVLGEILT